MSGTLEKLHEECAVFGISLRDDCPEEAAGICYNGLLAMQHRGQEGAGIAAARQNAITCHKDVGLVTEAFPPSVMENLPPARQAIAHARYSTTGSNTIRNVQPFVTEFLTGRIATAHNGNVVNAREIREKLTPFGLDFSATSDSEVISSLIAYKTIRARNLLTGVKDACKLLVGAFSLVVLSGEGKLVAVRDPNGYRPLCLGENESGVAVLWTAAVSVLCGISSRAKWCSLKTASWFTARSGQKLPGTACAFLNTSISPGLTPSSTVSACMKPV